MLPQSNARLRSVAGGGFSPDDSYAPGVDTSKWSGSADCYVSERIRFVPEGERYDQRKLTYLVVPGNLRPTVNIATEDVVTFDYAGATRTRAVKEVVAHLLPGALQTVRLYLEDD